jgi:hypothetical protein
MTTQPQDYNFRSFAKRRIKVGFAANRGLSGSAVTEAYSDGLKQSGLVQRYVARICYVLHVTWCSSGKP